MIGWSALIYREWMLFFGSKLEIGFSIFLPLVLLFFFSLNMSGVVGEIRGIPYISFIIPGIAVMTLLNSTLNAASRTFNEGFSPMLQELFSFPAARGTYVGTKILSATLLASLQGSLFLFGGLLIFGHRLTIDTALLGLGVLVVTAIGLAGLSLCLALLTKDMGAFLILNNLLGQVLIWTSTIFYPIESMQIVLRWIAMVNPLTYGTDILRSVYLSSFDASTTAWFSLTLFALLSGAAAIFLLAKRAAKVV